MIGVGLMAGGRRGSSAPVQATASAQLARHYPVDYFLQPTDTGQRDVLVPTAVAQRSCAAARPSPPSAAVRLDSGQPAGSGSPVGAVDPVGRRSRAQASP